MTPEAWTALGVFIFAQVIAWVAVLASLKGDTRSLRTDVNAMGADMKKIAEVVTTQAVQSQRMLGQDEKIMLYDGRIQTLEGRLNRFVDKQALTIMESVSR